MFIAAKTCSNIFTLKVGSALLANKQLALHLLQLRTFVTRRIINGIGSCIKCRSQYKVLPPECNAISYKILNIPTNQQWIASYCSRCTFVHNKLSADLRIQPPWRILFLGTDDFAVKHLDALYQNRDLPRGKTKVVDTLEVVCNKHKSAVREYAESQGLHIHNWPLDVPSNSYDVGVLVSFGHLIPDHVIHKFPYGILNVHPSLLPRWRGASPIIHTVLNGDKETGVSIMEIRPKHFDIGPLLMQKKCLVPQTVTSVQLSHILAELGIQMLVECLENLPWLEITETEQSRSGITYAHKVAPYAAHINWECQSCADIDRQYRALTGLVRLKTQWCGHSVHLLDKVSYEEMLDPNTQTELARRFSRHATPGQPHFLRDKGILCIKCKDGWVGFRGIVIKKKMPALDFYNGYLSKGHLRDVLFKSLTNYLNKDIYHEKIKQTGRL